MNSLFAFVLFVCFIFCIFSFHFVPTFSQANMAARYSYSRRILNCIGLNCSTYLVEVINTNLYYDNLINVCECCIFVACIFDKIMHVYYPSSHYKHSPPSHRPACPIPPHPFLPHTATLVPSHSTVLQSS